MQILDDLFQSVIPRHLEYEVLIVDNSSTDGTRYASNKIIGQCPNFKYIFEPIIGLSSARNTGWKASAGEYVAYIDDDCRIPAEWMTKVFQIIQERTPLAFGGPYLPYYMTPKPNWYKDAYGSFLDGNYPQRAQSADNFNLCGGNFVIQRKVLVEIGGFDIRLGMSGKNIGYAEEDDLQNRIRKQFPSGLIYFDPQLIVNHLVRPEKMRLHWRINQQFQRGKSLAILHNESGKHFSFMQFLMKAVNKVLLLISCLLRGMVNRDRIKYPRYIHWFYEVTALYFAQLGALKEKWAMQVESRR